MDISLSLQQLDLSLLFRYVCTSISDRVLEGECRKNERNKTTVISSIQNAMKKHKGHLQQQFDIEKIENATNTTVSQENVPDVIRDKVLEEIFAKRSAIRKRACDNLHLIYGLMQSKTATFEDLLRLVLLKAILRNE